MIEKLRDHKRAAALLRAAGAAELGEQNAWRLEPGTTYSVTRNGPSLIAFRLPEAAEQQEGR